MVGPSAVSLAANVSAPNEPSDFTLTARDARGQTVATVPMTVTDGHVDHVGAADAIMGTVPAAGVDSVAVKANGTVVATRTRPAHAPRVKLLAPRAGARVGAGRTVLVRWRATNPEHLALTVAIDYSRDDGRSWRTIFLGPNVGRIRLSSFYFNASRRARLRIGVNDGFNQTLVVSRPFTALGAPPEVAILSPARQIHVAGSADIQLTGEAFDQDLRALRGRSLRWLDGPFRLGIGQQLSAGPLPPGKNDIRLVARDAAGRTAQATVTIVVRRVVLRFLRLTIPAHVSAHARSLTIAASSRLPATLTIARSTFKLAHKTKRLRIRIKPGRQPLLLALRVASRGSVTQFAAEVHRFPR